MSRPKWSLETLKSQLASRPELKGWVVTQENVHRRERYFLAEGDALATDQDRDVRAQAIGLKLYVRLAAPGRQGEISKKLFLSLPLAAQLESAIEAARQTDHQAWELPTEVPTRLPELKTADPRMAEDIEGMVTEMTSRIAKSVAAKRPTRFNSAEMFLSVHDREVHLSNGFVHRSSQSRIYVESAYSFTRKDRSAVLSDEYLNTRWAVSSRDLPIERVFDDASERALHSLDVQKPETGKYAVIIDAEVLSTLLNGYLGHLSAANAYNGLPFIKPGDELIPGSTGDLLTLTLDPLLEYGADTTAVSEQGVVQVPLKLVDRNRVMATMADKRYSDYMGVPVTAVRGSLVLDPGKSGYEELVGSADQVIEILQFSGLFADPNSGTFSSEIRLAKLHDRKTGKATYLKGGSLSGSIVENFRHVRLSSAVVNRAHFVSDHPTGEGYRGPEHALLSEVSIVG